MADRTYHVLFLCTGNTARSILAESILRKDGAGRFTSHSAGSRPKGAVNPFAIKVLEAYGYPTDGFRSKSWDEFAAPVLRRWISCSRSATARLARPARSGLASR